MGYAYRAVADDILRKIREGEWREGERIPSLNELEKLYPQSRMTLYRALRYLVDAGCLSASRGRGTFVRSAHARRRVAILSGASLVLSPMAPFLSQTIYHSKAFFARCGIDAQLYIEDSFTTWGLPTGLQRDLEQRKISALMSIDATFPVRYMLTREWREHAVAHVQIGARESPYRVHVDRDAFVREALQLAKRHGCRRAALVEKPEHFSEDTLRFRSACDAAGLVAHPGAQVWPSGDLPYEDYGFEAVGRIWKGADRPDALIVPDDVIAKGVTQAALKLKLRVPREMRIVAMVNRGLPLFYPVPVEVIEVDVESVAERAGNLLLDLINGAQMPPRTLLVEPTPVMV